MPDITTYELKTAFAPLEKFDHLAKPDDFIEVSLWHNGEGFDAHHPQPSRRRSCPHRPRPLGPPRPPPQAPVLMGAIETKCPECGSFQVRAARRPKPPGLKEQALTELNLTADSEGAELSRTQVELIRRALEQLDD